MAAARVWGAYCRRGGSFMAIVHAIAGFLAGTLSAMGLGGGTLLMLYMTSIGGLQQHQAQAVNLLSFIPSAGVSLGSHIKGKQVEFAAAVPAVLTGAAFSVLGAALALRLDERLLRKGFGGLLVVIGLREVFSKK